MSIRQRIKITDAVTGEELFSHQYMGNNELTSMGYKLHDRSLDKKSVRDELFKSTNGHIQFIATDSVNEEIVDVDWESDIDKDAVEVHLVWLPTFEEWYADVLKYHQSKIDNLKKQKTFKNPDVTVYEDSLNMLYNYSKDRFESKQFGDNLYIEFMTDLANKLSPYVASEHVMDENNDYIIVEDENGNPTYKREHIWWYRRNPVKVEVHIT